MNDIAPKWHIGADQVLKCVYVMKDGGKPIAIGEYVDDVGHLRSRAGTEVDILVNDLGDINPLFINLPDFKYKEISGAEPYSPPLSGRIGLNEQRR